MEINADYNDLIEEAVDLIIIGLETFESCADHYGRAWPAMANSVRAALELHELRAEYDEKTRQLDVDGLWNRLKPQIAPSKPATLVSESVNIFELLETTRQYIPQQPANNSTGASNQLLEFKKPASAPKNQKRSNVRRVVNGWNSPLLKIAAVLLLFFMGSGAFLSTAEASAPSDFLYNVKLVIEHVGEWVATSEEGKTDAALAYAQRRLDEIEQAVQGGNYKGLELAANSYKDAALSAINYSHGSAATLAQLDVYQTRLTQISQSGALPPAVQTTLAQAGSLKLGQPAVNLATPGAATATALPTNTATAPVTLLTATPTEEQVSPLPQEVTPTVVPTVEGPTRPVATKPATATALPTIFSPAAPTTVRATPTPVRATPVAPTSAPPTATPFVPTTVVAPATDVPATVAPTAAPTTVVAPPTDVPPTPTAVPPTPTPAPTTAPPADTPTPDNGKPTKTPPRATPTPPHGKPTTSGAGSSAPDKPANTAQGGNSNK